MKRAIFVVWLLFVSSFTLNGLCGDPSETARDNVGKSTGISPEKPATVNMDFQDIDIRDFVSYVSELTGTNMILDPQVKGTVTIVAPAKIPPGEVLHFFQSALEIHGYTTVNAGPLVKIIPSPKARGKSIETGTREPPGTARDTVATEVIHLHYLNPTDAKKLLTPLLSESGVIIDYPQTGALIITDTHSNMGRLQQIIETMDVAPYKETMEGERE
jgi:general secretion pathway protein D